MLTVRVGKMKMPRRQQWIMQCMFVLVPLVIFITFMLHKNVNPFTTEWRQTLLKVFDGSSQVSETSQKDSAGPCSLQDCQDDHFGFFIQSGATNAVGPKICVQNKLILGTVLNNAGHGINIVTVNGKTGEILKMASFNMYSGEVAPLIEFLKSIEMGTVVLIASFDEPSSKLNDEARKLIAELGSTAAKSLGYRDNWVFVGGKGAVGAVQSNFEKHMKNDKEKNKYEEWPEIIDMQGCIPKFME